MSGSAEWKPKLRCEIRRMRLLSPSRRPLFSPRRIAARMPARWRRIVRASLTNGSSFDLEAQASQASRCAGARAGAARSGDPAVGVPANRRGRRGNVYRCNSDGQRPLVLYDYARRIMPAPRADDRVAKVRASPHALNQTSRATLSLGEHHDPEPASNGK